MIWPLLLAHLLALKPGSSRHRNRSYQEKERSNQTTQQQVFLAILIGLVLLALFFSASRGGIISSLVALTVFITFSGRNRGSTTFFLAACWLVMLAYGSIIGFDEILARFDIMEKSAPGRFKIWEDTRRLISDHLWTGTGLGTYETVIRLYQSHLTDQLQIGHAHNDYLELMAELGIPAAGGIILLAWAYWWKTAYSLMKEARNSFDSTTAEPRGDGRRHRRVSSRPFDGHRLLQAGALAGSAAFLCHSWVEFNWQMPANQMIFIMLLVVMKEKLELTSKRTWL
jgi:O-antigen ligase